MNAGSEPDKPDVIATVIKLHPSQATVTDEMEREYYWKRILEYWGLPAHFQHFPGPNPVSIEKANLETLKAADFLVALKSDGIRYLLIMTTKPNSTEPISLMIDRTLKMYEVEIWASEEFFYRGCLLDGELVWNTDESMQFIIFDVVTLKGESCKELNYRNRLEVIRGHIYCVDTAIDDVTLEKILSEEDKFCARNNAYNLQLTAKVCVSKHQIADVWQAQSKCTHRNDGLVLTRNDAAVHTGTSRDIFKWKPSHTIDIKVRVLGGRVTLWANRNSSKGEVEITDGIADDAEFYRLHVEELDRSKLVQALKTRKDEFVVECVVSLPDRSTIRLVAERERTDKATANTVKTIIATILNVGENITVEDLLQL